LKNNKTLIFIKNLHPLEIKQFKKFATSPYFNSNRKLFKLSEYLCKEYPFKREISVKAETMFNYVYGNIKFNRQMLHNLFTALNKLFIDFIIQLQLENDEFNRHLFLTKQFRSRKYFKETINNINSGLKQIDTSNTNVTDRLNRRFLLLTEQAELFLLTAEHNKFIDNEVIRAEVIAYKMILEMIEIAGNIFAYEKFFPSNEKKLMFKAIWDSLDFNRLIKQAGKLDQNDAILLEMSLLEYLILYGENKSENYYKLEKLVKENLNRFNFNDKFKIWDIMTKSIDFSLSYYDKSFKKKSHVLNIYFIENGAYVSEDENNVNDNNIRSIFSCAIIENDWKWAEQFVEKYHNYLSPELRDNTYNYLIGQCRMQEKNFGKALSHFSKVKLKDIIINLDVRVLILKCHFELNHWEELISSIDSFKHFLVNQEIPGYLDRDYKTFFRLLAKIIQYKINKHKIDVSSIKEAQERNTFIEKKWIIQKLKDLVYNN